MKETLELEASGFTRQLQLPETSPVLDAVPEGDAVPCQPAEMLALLPAYLRGAELIQVARLRTRREGVLADGAEIVDDSVAVLEGQHVSRRFREVEVELLDGDERTLRRLEKELHKAGARATGALQPKLYRALDLAGTPETRKSTKKTPPGEALAIAFEAEYRALLMHDPGTRRGDDAEDLHQLRVAIRRLRAFLRAARPLVDREWGESLRSELGWLGGHLGPARDLDVLLQRFRSEIEALGEDGEGGAGFLEALEEERAAAYRDVAETLDGDRYYALLDRVEAAARPPLSGDSRSLTKIFEKETKRMRKAFDALSEESADEELHEARIKVKRARYAADLAAHELGDAGAKFVSVAKQMQDLLGGHQDAVVAQARIRDWAASSFTPETGFAAGRLVQLERDRMAEARHEWPALWKKLDAAARKAAT